MPRLDGTGPMGHGPRTGRGLGYCRGYSDDLGYRRGRGRGLGFGFRRGGLGMRRRGFGPRFMEDAVSDKELLQRELENAEDYLKHLTELMGKLEEEDK